MQTDLQKQRNKENLVSVITIACIVLVVVAIVWGSDIAAFFGNIIEKNLPYTEYIEKQNYIDEENGLVVLTYPAEFFTDQDSMKESLDKEEGIKKVVKNDDGSLTVVMDMTQYEKTKEAVSITASGMVLSAIREEIGIMDAGVSEDFTTIDLTVNREIYTDGDEVSNCLYMARVSQVCNLTSDNIITINYIDYSTSEKFLIKKYDVEGNLISEEEFDITESETV